jgi:two-component system OmpR family response regulator
MRVLLVEDDSRLAGSLRRGLEEEGLGVDLVGDGEEAVAAASTTPFDLILLDVMLPGRWDGFQTCVELRKRRLSSPVLMLTARDTVDDRVRGLDAGADDYLVKPFAFRELLARARALGRRHLDQRSAALHFGPLTIDSATRGVSVGSVAVQLSSKEFAILEFFALHPRQVFTRSQIEEHIWNYDFDSSSNLVDVYVSRIRRKLMTAGDLDPIATVRGVGYRFDPPA